MAQCTAKEPENHTRCLLLQLAKVYLLLIGLSDFPRGKMCLNVSPYLKNKTKHPGWFGFLKQNTPSSQTAHRVTVGVKSVI